MQVATVGSGRAVERWEPRVVGWIFTLLGLPFLGAYAIAPFVRRTPGAWTCHLVLICIGLTSGCCLPITIPLLVFWIQPQTRAFFGRGSA